MHINTTGKQLSSGVTRFDVNWFVNWFVSLVVNIYVNMRFSSRPSAWLDPSTNFVFWILCWSQSTTLPSYNSLCLWGSSLFTFCNIVLLSLCCSQVCEVLLSNLFLYLSNHKKSISSPLLDTNTIYNLMLLNTSLYTTLSILLLSWLCSGRSTEMFRGEVHLEKAT